MKIRTYIIFGILLTALAVLTISAVLTEDTYADSKSRSHSESHDNDHDGDGDHDDDDADDEEMSFFDRIRERERRERRFSPIDNETYKMECADCHFLYFPGLLPSASWEKIMSDPEDHFGEDLGIDKKDAANILTYLKDNAAEKSSAKRAKKIMNTLGRKVPSRVIDVPYIKHKHKGIKKHIFDRESIQSLSNCGACHTTADKGEFSEHLIKIPRK